MRTLLNSRCSYLRVSIYGRGIRCAVMISEQSDHGLNTKRRDRSIWRVSAALCVLLIIPVAMAWAWICYFAVYLGMAPDYWNSCLAISGIAAAYSLDRVLDLDPRLDDEAYAGWPMLLRLLFIIALALSLLCLWMSAASQWPIVCICAGLSVGNWLGKKITGAKTLFVTAAWTCACFFLPFVDLEVNARSLGCLLIWMPIFALSCVMCDIKDVSFDRLRRIRSLPVTMEVREARRFVMILLLFIVVVAVYAAYLELALRDGLPLATLDKDLLRAAKRSNIDIYLK